METKELLKKKKLENIEIVKVLLVKDPGSPYRKQLVKKSADVVSVVKKFLAGEDREVFISINVDNFNRINSINIVSVGSLDASVVHPREVFKAAILSNAKGIIIAHNHPSGNPMPSDEDSQMTCRLFQCGDLLGIKVYDHIIMGDGQYSHCEVFGGKDKKKEIMWLTDKIRDDEGVD